MARWAFNPAHRACHHRVAYCPRDRDGAHLPSASGAADPPGGVLVPSPVLVNHPATSSRQIRVGSAVVNRRQSPISAADSTAGIPAGPPARTGCSAAIAAITVSDRSRSIYRMEHCVVAGVKGQRKGRRPEALLRQLLIAPVQATPDEYTFTHRSLSAGSHCDAAPGSITATILAGPHQIPCRLRPWVRRSDRDDLTQIRRPRQGRASRRSHAVSAGCCNSGGATRQSTPARANTGTLELAWYGSVTTAPTATRYRAPASTAARITSRSHRVPPNHRPTLGTYPGRHPPVDLSLGPP